MSTSDTATATKEFGPCPACDEPITATAEVSLSRLNINGAYRTVDVDVVGLSVSHDCGTKVTTDEPTTDDEWVEVDDWPADLPKGARMRQEWVKGAPDNRYFVHRDDLPDGGDE